MILKILKIQSSILKPNNHRGKGSGEEDDTISGLGQRYQTGLPVPKKLKRPNLAISSFKKGQIQIQRFSTQITPRPVFYHDLLFFTFLEKKTHLTVQ